MSATYYVKHKKMYSVGFKAACAGTGPAKLVIRGSEKIRKPQWKSIADRKAERARQRLFEVMNKERLMKAANIAHCQINELHNRANRWALKLAAVNVKAVEA